MRAEWQTVAGRIGKDMVVASLMAATAGLVLYYALPEVEAPILAFAALRLADVWRLSGVLLLGGVSGLLLGGPSRAGDLFSLARFLGWTTWAVAQAVAVVWLALSFAVLPATLGAPETWARLALWSLVVAFLLSFLTFDFRASPWAQRHRAALMNAAAVVLGLLIAAALAEWAMRYVFRPPVFSPLLRKSSVAECGFEMKPGFDGPCGNVRVRLNSDGFRSPEIAPEKSRQRILAIGDSVTFGAWVEQDETFPAVLQQLLPPNEYEVINAGIPGYHLDQIIALFQHKGVRWQPDVVVYTFVYDDISDALVLDESGALLQKQGRRYGGGLAMADRYRFLPLPRWLVNRSRLLTAVVMRYYRFRETRHVLGERDLLGDLLIERWGWLEERLIKLRDQVEKANARFLFVVFPVGLRQQSIARLIAIARANQIEALELRSVLGDARTYAAKYMTPWDAHPNADAHARMAETIHAKLLQDQFLAK